MSRFLSKDQQWRNSNFHNYRASPCALPHFFHIFSASVQLTGALISRYVFRASSSCPVAPWIQNCQEKLLLTCSHFNWTIWLQGLWFLILFVCVEWRPPHCMKVQVHRLKGRSGCHFAWKRMPLDERWWKRKLFWLMFMLITYSIYWYTILINMCPLNLSSPEAFVYSLYAQTACPVLPGLQFPECTMAYNSQPLHTLSHSQSADYSFHTPKHNHHTHYISTYSYTNARVEKSNFLYKCA